MRSGPYGFAALDHEKNGMKKKLRYDRSIPLYIYLHIEISLVKHHIIAR